MNSPYGPTKALKQMNSIGLALGGGGVKGLAHLALLKKLDQLGIQPTHIAGTSIGAILGALYACGITGAEIEERVKSHIISPGDNAKTVFKRRKHLIKWAKVFSREKSKGGFIAADGLFEHLFHEIVDRDFADLAIRFTAVATDFHTGAEVALKQGPLLPAVQASMAVPGVFAPVSLNGSLLVDGGLVNNVPISHLHDCDFVIASDVFKLPRAVSPKTSEVVSGALSIMMSRQTQISLEKHPPDLLFEPDTLNINGFDFLKISQVLSQGDEAANLFESSLKCLKSDI